MSVKILIDPCYVRYYPFHLLPRILLSNGTRLHRFLRRISGSGLGMFPRWAFGPEGFDGMDLGISYTRLLRPDLSLRERVLSRYRKARWPIYAFHATFQGGARFFADTAMELSEDNDRTRRGLRNQIRAAAEIAGRGAILVLHLGAATGSVKASLQRTIRLLEAELPYAEEKGVILAAENMPRPIGGRYFLGADYRDLKEVFKALPSPFLKACFDWGHANSYAELFASQGGRSPTENDLRTFGYCREMIQELGREIVYAHIHYNRSHRRTDDQVFAGGDEHMPLTRIPPADWDAFCGTLRLLTEISSIQNSGRINLELIPRRFFGFYSVFPSGSSRCEQASSLRLLRDVLDQASGRSSASAIPRVFGAGVESRGKRPCPEVAVGFQASD